MQIHKIIGFAPVLLQVVMAGDIEMPVRQAGESLPVVMYLGCWLRCGRSCVCACSRASKAEGVIFLFLKSGVIYMKNMVTQNWQEREVEPGQPLPFHIHEQDRAMIRDAIVDAVVHAPDLIR